MIKITKDTQIPSVTTALTMMKAYNSLMPIFLDFDKLCQYICWYQMEIGKIEKPLFDSLKGVPSRDKANQLLIIWLQNRKEDMSVFERTSTDSISLSKPSVTKAKSSGKLSEEAMNMIETYEVYTNYVKVRRTLIGLLQFPVVDFYSYDNHRMISIRPGWRAQNTGRIAMYDPALQNLPRVIQDLFTVPKGWTLIHTDSGQVEPRIIYSAYIKDPQIQALINLYDDAYFGVLHYCTMPEEDIRSGRLVFDKHEITPEMKESRKAIKTYNNAVMYGSTSNRERDPIKDKLIQRIGKHPQRIAWVNRIREQIQSGDLIFKTYFGSSIDISKSDKLESYYENGEDPIEQMIKLGINNPIQGTAADLMRISLANAYEILSREAPNSVIISYVHDAGMFAIAEQDLPKVEERIKDIVAYDIDGWVPIKAEPEVNRQGGLFKDLY